MATASACLDFDGTAKVLFDDVVIYDGLNAVSTIYWFNPTVFNIQTSVIRKDGTYTAQQGDGNGFGSVYWPFNVEKITHTPTNLEWHHYASIWDKDDNSGKTSYYRDFSFLNDSSGFTSAISSGGSNAMVFGSALDGNEAYNGKLSLVMSFNRKLTVPEIQELNYNPYSVVDGVVGSWSLDDSGSTQYDKSGNANTGTITNTTTNTEGPPVFLLGGQ